jgi:Mechanosensitive ion channel, conserved TM helix
MPEPMTEPLAGLIRRFTDYLPTLAAGLLVLGLGFAVGWVAKRAVERILVWLRLDRLAGRVGWRSAFAKGDVRAALYDLLGTATFFVVVLVFLDNALTIWGLAVLSRLIDGLVLALPRLALAALIVGVGVAVAGAASARVEDALEEEEVGYARLLAKGLKAVLLAVVAAVALWELDLARQIVLSGFVIAFGAMGVAFALSVGLGSARAIQRGWEGLIEKRKRKPE